MKRIMTISALAVACLIVVGCKEEQCDWAAYNGSGANPCDEGEGSPCEDYPPEGVAISWNDYNTVAELVDYFDCHRKTQMEHFGDTLKVMGWLDESWIAGANYETNDSMVYWTVLTDDTSQYGTVDNKNIYVFKNERFDLTSLRGRKLYITGRFEPYELGIGGCCSMASAILIQSIDFD